MKTKSNLFFVFAILTIVIIGGLVLIKGDTQTTNQIEANNQVGTTSGASGNLQVVKMYVDGGSYVFEPSEIRAGIPVRIEADISKMPGCSKSIVIPSFGVRKTLTSTDNVITFTPDKAGTFNIACSMNMYKGTFTVLQEDGSESNFVDTSAPKGASCGAGGGGCGCGG